MRLPKEFWFSKFSVPPRTVCEVGTGGLTAVFQCQHFLDLPTTKFILVEANPTSFAIVKSNFDGKPNFTLHHKAVCDTEGPVKYYHPNQQKGEDASGFIEGVVAPCMVKHQYVPSDDNVTMVEGVKFSTIDDGQIDVLFCDIEGAEWYVLKHMISRPKIISLETHGNYLNHHFVNIHLDKIQAFMKENGYTFLGTQDDDSLYVKS
jgi:FkbM family methyltransferase